MGPGAYIYNLWMLWYWLYNSGESSTATSEIIKQWILFVCNKCWLETTELTLQDWGEEGREMAHLPSDVQHIQGNIVNGPSMCSGANTTDN